jgi:hypothetical protein
VANSRERKPSTTLEECEAAGGARVPKSKRISLEKCVRHFLEEAIVPPEGIEKKSQRKQDICNQEIISYNKAQERLREIIAMGGTDAIAELADVRNEKQRRPVMLGKFRAWMG